LLKRFIQEIQILSAAPAVLSQEVK